MKTIFVLLWAWCTGVFACTPGQNLDVYFEKNSAYLSSSEISRLALWFVDVRIRYPRHDFLQISGIAEGSEKHSSALAHARAQATRDYFRRTRYEQAPVITDSSVRKARYFSTENLQRTEIMLAPLPPHGCSNG